MSDRPAAPAQPPAPPRTPAGRPGGPTGSRPPATQPVATPRLDKSEPAGAGDTAVRAGLAERIQAKLASATQGKDGSDDAGTATGGTPSKKSRPRGPRRARLRLTRVDPWSVMKTAFLLSIAFGIVTVVAVAMIWQVIDAAGVWNSINSSINEVVAEPGRPPFDIRDYVGTDRVLGFTMLVAAADVVLITAIATLSAFLYNMSAALLGGIEVTLAEDN